MACHSASMLAHWSEARGPECLLRLAGRFLSSSLVMRSSVRMRDTASLLAISTLIAKIAALLAWRLNPIGGEGPGSFVDGRSAISLPAATCNSSR